MDTPTSLAAWDVATGPVLASERPANLTEAEAPRRMPDARAVLHRPGTTSEVAVGGRPRSALLVVGAVTRHAADSTVPPSHTTQRVITHAIDAVIAAGGTRVIKADHDKSLAACCPS